MLPCPRRLPIFPVFFCSKARGGGVVFLRAMLHVLYVCLRSYGLTSLLRIWYIRMYTGKLWSTYQYTFYKRLMPVHADERLIGYSE